MNRFDRKQQATLSGSSSADDDTKPVAVVKKGSENRVRALHQLIVKLTIVDQVKLYRTFKEVRPICDKVWLNAHKRLNFRVLEKWLDGELLGFFVSHMQDNFLSVHFTADSLQRNLNILDRSGVKSLINVRYCNLLMSPESQLKNKAASLRQTNTGDASARRRVRAVLRGSIMPQWPLHALPKLLCNLRRLMVHCDVQVHFIEQFTHLETLVLHGDVSQSALTGILERCINLKRLFIKSPNPPSDMHCINNCSKLQELLLPMSIYSSVSEKVLSLSALRLLELTTSAAQNVEDIEKLTIECLGHLIKKKASDIKVLQINCLNFRGSIWTCLGLRRCRKLQGLVLNYCPFEDLVICKKNMPRVNKYLVLNGCPDVTDSQVVSMVRRCPGLIELFLFNCPMLTGKVLFSIYKVRRDERLKYPLNIILDNCDAVQMNYQASFPGYWHFRQHIVKVEYSTGENKAFEGLQIIFYKDFAVSKISNEPRSCTSVAKISMKHEKIAAKISREVSATKISMDHGKQASKISKKVNTSKMSMDSDEGSKEVDTLETPTNSPKKSAAKTLKESKKLIAKKNKETTISPLS